MSLLQAENYFKSDSPLGREIQKALEKFCLIVPLRYYLGSLVKIAFPLFDKWETWNTLRT